jgi:GTPase SAR1 family protein
VPDKRELKFKVILLGESGVGKTSLIRRYVRGSFSESYIQTMLLSGPGELDFLGAPHGEP